MTTLKRLLLATSFLTAINGWNASAATQTDSRIILAQQAAPEPEKKPAGKPPAKPAPKPAPAPAQRPAAPAKPTPPATRQAPPPAAAQPRRPDQPPPPATRQPQPPATQQPQRRDMPQRPTPQERRELQRPTTQTPPPRTTPQSSPAPARPAPAQVPAQRREPPPAPAPVQRVQPQQPPAATTPPPAVQDRRRPSERESAPPPATPQAPASQPAPQQSQTPAPETRQAPATAQPQRIEELRQERREERRGDRTFIREGDRTIIREGDRTIIRRDEADRFRGRGSRDVRTERRGNENFTIVGRPGGGQIVTVTDADGRLIRRARRDAGGREVIIIDNRPRGPRRAGGFFVQLPPPVIRIPREHYIVEADRADPAMIYETLIAPPVERIEHGYTLDEVRYSAPLRDRMPRIDIDTITFDTGSWDVTADQADRLAPIAEGIRRAIERNPNEVFLVEGHTDAVGADIDNLSLSDRRAESVANLLADQFGIPPENLTTQGYGEEYLKIPTDGPERQNRRVTMRRITPLLTGENGPPPQ